MGLGNCLLLPLDWISRAGSLQLECLSRSPAKHSDSTDQIDANIGLRFPVVSNDCQ